MFSFSFLPSYLWLCPSIQQPCQVQPHATMCNISSEEMSGFPMGSGGQGRLSLHVSCCSVSFFQLSMSHVLELKVSETSTWLEEVGLCSIVVELCGNCMLFLAPAPRASSVSLAMAMAMFSLSASFPNAFLEEARSFFFETKSDVSSTLLSDVYLVWSTYIHL